MRPASPGVASQGLQLLFLKYSRDAENQADMAGFRYALNQGYDVRHMTNVMEMLDRESKLGGGGRLPDWLATHPNPGARIQHITSMLDTVHRDLSHAINRQEAVSVFQCLFEGDR